MKRRSFCDCLRRSLHVSMGRRRIVGLPFSVSGINILLLTYTLYALNWPTRYLVYLWRGSH